MQCLVVAATVLPQSQYRKVLGDRDDGEAATQLSILRSGVEGASRGQGLASAYSAYSHRTMGTGSVRGDLLVARHVRLRVGLYPWRHTYISLSLVGGISINDVAQQVGNSPSIVEKHYAKWIPTEDDTERLQNQLEGILS